MPRCSGARARASTARSSDGVAAPGRRRRRPGDRRPRRPARWPARPAWLADFDGRHARARPAATTAPTWPACPPTPGSAFAYGPGSFDRHRPRPAGSACALRVVRDPRLGWDVDVPDDLDYARLPPRRRPSGGPMPLSVPATSPSPAGALAIGAHPDDVEFGCGATLAKWAAGRLRGAPPRLHRRLEGHAGTRRGHRRARRHPPGRAAGRGRSALGATGEVRVPRLGRRRARGRPAPAGPRWPAGSASCGPTSCSATTRGSATGSTPTTATPGSWPSTASWRPATRTSSPSRASPTTARRRCCSSRPTSPTTSRTSPGSTRPKLAALESHASQFESTMEIIGGRRGRRPRALRPPHPGPAGRGRPEDGRGPRRAVRPGQPRVARRTVTVNGRWGRRTCGARRAGRTAGCARRPGGDRRGGS